MHRVSFAIVMLFAAGIGCGYASDPGINCTPTDTRICMNNDRFTAAVDTVTVGAAVQWVNADGHPHTTTSSSVPVGASSWDRDVPARGQASMTFTVAGTYEYYCTIHGSPGAGMHGTLVVE